jgi:hypothetical protein
MPVGKGAVDDGPAEGLVASGGCGECQGNALRGLVDTSPLHPAAPAPGAAVVTSASLMAVRRCSPTPPTTTTVADHRGRDPRIR